MKNAENFLRKMVFVIRVFFFFFNSFEFIFSFFLCELQHKVQLLQVICFIFHFSAYCAVQ